MNNLSNIYSTDYKIGIARFTFQKMEKSEDTKWNHGIEIYHWESFNIDFLANSKTYGYDHLYEVIRECGQEEVLALVCEELKLETGFYEIIGDVYYEFDPGYSSPSGPAEPNEWWWLENARFIKLDEERINHWVEINRGQNVSE